MKKFDVYGVCNPLIDLLCHIPDSFLEKHRIEKDMMHLVSLEEQEKLLKALELEKFSVELSAGGSGANSMIGISQLGGNAAFSGKIGNDEHGYIYKKKLEKLGVEVFLGQGDGATGSSLVLVSDDGKRTMNTYLGISQELNIYDINPEAIQSSECLYLTGYLWDTESQKKSVKYALDEAKKSKIKVALSLSDPFCVIRHKSNFKKLLQSQTSILFCNKEEAFTLLDKNATQKALETLSQWIKTIVLTLGEKGAVISHNREIFYIDPLPVKVVDTTGAGDAFAAGFLYGITQNFSPLDSGLIGATLAGAVVEQTGARYNGEAKNLIREKIGIIL